MTRLIATVTVALAFAVGAATSAQEVKSKTTIKGDNVKRVVYTGCLQSGTEARTFILDKVVPIGQTTRTTAGTSGTITTTTTTYALIPEQRVELLPHVGHKVEVTGILISGDVKTRTKTEIEREHGKDTKIEEKGKIEGALPQLRVTSIKHLADACTME